MNTYDHTTIERPAICSPGRIAGIFISLAFTLLAPFDCALGQGSTEPADDGWSPQEIVMNDDFLGLRTELETSLILEEAMWVSERWLVENRSDKRVPFWSAPVSSSLGKGDDGCYRFDLGRGRPTPPPPFTPWNEEITPYPNIAVARVLKIIRGASIEHRGSFPKSRYFVEVDSSYSREPPGGPWKTSQNPEGLAEIIALGALFRGPDRHCIRHAQPHHIPSTGDRVLILRRAFTGVLFGAYAGHGVSEGVIFEIKDGKVIIPSSSGQPRRTIELESLIQRLNSRQRPTGDKGGN